MIFCHFGKYQRKLSVCDDPFVLLSSFILYLCTGDFFLDLLNAGSQAVSGDFQVLVLESIKDEGHQTSN